MSGYTQLMLLGGVIAMAFQALQPLFNPFYFWVA